MGVELDELAMKTTRLAFETKPPNGVVTRCASCLNRIELSRDYFRDLDSDDELCIDCASWYIANDYAIRASE